MSTTSQVIASGFESNPTFRFIALLQKSPAGKFSDDVFKSLQDTAKELKAASNAHWLNPLKQKLIGASDESCIQLCAIWKTIIENNESAKLQEKDITEIIKHLLDKYLSNKNSEALTIITMLWGYGWCSIETIAFQIHNKINRPEQFYKRFCMDSIQWALEKIINHKLKISENLTERFLKLFRDANKDDLSKCSYQLFNLLYTFSILYKGILFDTLYNIKIYNKIGNDLINGILDFFLAIALSAQNLANKSTEIIKFINKIKLGSSDKIKFSESVLYDCIKEYVDRLATELTHLQSDMLSLVCEQFTQAETDNNSLLDILFQLEKQFEFYFLNTNIQAEMASISQTTTELTLISRSPLIKNQSKTATRKKLSKSEGGSPEVEKSSSKVRTSKSDSPSDASAIRFRLSRSDADDKEYSPERFHKSPPDKNEEKTPSPHSSSEGIALKKSRPRNLLNFKETISPEKLKFTKERFLKYKPIPSRDNLHKSKSPLDDILLPEEEIIVNDEEFNENERNIRVVGIWGEAALFLQLKEKYLDKYKITENSSTISKANGFILKIPESDNNPKKLTEIEVIWPNKSLWEEWCKSKKEQAFVDPATQPYDLTITKKFADGKIQINYAEVKSTPGNTKQKIPATMTGREFRFMLANKDNYRMYRCYLAGTDNPSFVKHKNLAEELLDKECEIKEIRCMV